MFKVSAEKHHDTTICAKLTMQTLAFGNTALLVQLAYTKQGSFVFGLHRILWFLF